MLMTTSCFYKEKQDTSQLTTSESTAFFVSIPIVKFSSTQAPCISVQIEDNTFLMELDLGLRGDLSITSSFINQISSKTFISTVPMYGFNGKEHLTHLYRIPKVKIGGMILIEPILQENSYQSRQESVITQNGNPPSPREPGRIGWELFHNVNLLLDIQNSRIAFCDSIETLKNHGYQIESFIKAPLLIERGLVELEAKTPIDLLRCVLDTGSTYNILNTEIEEAKSIEEVIWAPSNSLEYSSFKINETEFGPIIFHRIPIKLPIQIDAILGMEFFENHLVFLDFSKKQVYFRKEIKKAKKQNS